MTIAEASLPNRGSSTVGLARVGIVMTSYNGEAYIATALHSLIAQSFTEWECVVVDDGSSDETAEIVRRIAESEPRITLICQPRAGVSQARNTGLAALGSSVCYVALLDCDDSYLVGSLQSLVAALQARDDAVGVYGLAELMDAEGLPINPGWHPTCQLSRRRIKRFRLHDVATLADSTFADISVGGAIWPSAVGLHRRSAIDAVDGFDVTFTRQGDWDLYLRMSRIGPFAILPEQVAWYRRHDTNLTANTTESFYQQERARRKAWLSPLNTREQRRMIVRGARWLQLAAGKTLLGQLKDDLVHRRIAYAAWDLMGLLWLTGSLVGPGPPRPSRRRIRSLLHHQSNSYGSR